MNTRPSELDNKTDPIGNKTDEASAAVGGIQVSAPLDATAAETTKFCTKQCTISSTFIVVIVYVLAIVSNFLVSVASGRFAGSVIGFLVVAITSGSNLHRRRQNPPCQPAPHATRGFMLPMV
jgi:hypothetical protein